LDEVLVARLGSIDDEQTNLSLALRTFRECGQTRRPPRSDETPARGRRVGSPI